MNFKKYIIYFGAIIIFFSIGFWGGFKMAQNRIQTDENLKYSQGWEDAKKRFAKLCALPGPNDKVIEVKVFHGIIKEKKDNQIIVDSDSFSQNNKERRVLSVNITKDTEIKQTKPKEASQYQKELADYYNKAGGINRGAEPSEPPPLAFEQTVISQDSLKLNQAITVTAANEINETDKEVIAAEILVSAEPAKSSE